MGNCCSKNVKKCHVTLWLTPLPRVLFGDNVANPPHPWSVTYYLNGHLKFRKRVSLTQQYLINASAIASVPTQKFPNHFN